MNRSRHGFTLIEVMVALAIIAIALASLIKASGNHTYSASYLKSKTLAHYVAMNEVTLLKLAQTWPDLGTEHKSTELAGIDWFWTRTVEKTADETGNLRSIRFTVYQDEDRNQNLTTLQAYISKPEPAANSNAASTGTGTGQ